MINENNLMVFSLYIAFLKGFAGIYNMKNTVKLENYWFCSHLLRSSG